MYFNNIYTYIECSLIRVIIIFIQYIVLVNHYNINKLIESYVVSYFVIFDSPIIFNQTYKCKIILFIFMKGEIFSILERS